MNTKLQTKLETKNTQKFLFAVMMLSLVLLSGCGKSNQVEAPPVTNTTPVASNESNQKMNITRSGTQKAVQGSPENFTGSVKVEPIFSATDPSRASGGRVTFEPGARSNWHAHPLGQTLIVTSGTGWIQQWSGQIEEIREGDVVWTPPGVKHWHGATPTTTLTHIAIQESLDGKNVSWMEKVSDEQYKSK